MRSAFRDRVDFYITKRKNFKYTGKLLDKLEFTVICKSTFQDVRTQVKYSCLD